MQDYGTAISVIIAIWVFILTIRFGSHLDKQAGKNYYNPIAEKSCPPHSWRWEDQPGMENTCYLRCLACGKTPRQITDGT